MKLTTKINLAKKCNHQNEAVKNVCRRAMWKRKISNAFFFGFEVDVWQGQKCGVNKMAGYFMMHK